MAASKYTKAYYALRKIFDVKYFCIDSFYGLCFLGRKADGTYVKFLCENRSQQLFDIICSCTFDLYKHKNCVKMFLSIAKDSDIYMSCADGLGPCEKKIPKGASIETLLLLGDLMS